jgi:excisionase family DNA binding protein
VSERFISGREAAKRLHCHHRTVRRWVNAGRLDGQVVGGRLVIAEASVAAIERRSEMLRGPRPAKP